ncbi:hypothetical protein D3C81_2303250 [compost metagenome]
MDGYKGEEGRSGNCALAGVEVFRDDFDKDLDAGSACPGDEGFEAHRICGPNRQEEVYRVC